MKRTLITALALLIGVGCLEEDFDADGFGVSEDCDDHRATINPDAVDVCNGMDDNCDGVIDESATGSEGGALQIWVDYDGDGWGVDGTERFTCQEAYLAVGYATQGGDCNDAAYRANPGSQPQCGGDYNCDGVDDGSCDGWTAPSNEPNLQVASDAFAQAHGVLLLATTWNGLPAIAAAQDAAVKVATPDGTSVRTQLSGTGNATFKPNDIAHLGSHLLISSNDLYTSGIFYGGVLVADISTTTGSVSITPDSHPMLRSSDRSLGASSTPLEGHGAELLFAVGSTVDGGRVLLHNFTPSATEDPFPLVATLTGSNGVGTDLVNVDLDGDGADELVVADAVASGVWLLPGPVTSGEAPISDAGTWLAGPSSTEVVVSRVGDLSGDGTDDLATTFASGDAYLVSGLPSSGDLLVHQHVFVLSDAGQTTPVKLAWAGDVSGDGLDDLLVGVPSDVRMGVVLGPIEGSGNALDFAAGWRGVTTSVPPLVGEAILGTGDVNGDGINDIAGTYAGYSYVVYGGSL